MKKRIFRELLASRWAQRTFVCVGLDSDYACIAKIVRSNSIERTIFEFNRAIIDATHDLVCAYKINSAFYEAYAMEDISALIRTVAYINHVAQDIPVILDAKRADIGTTNLAYVRAAFDVIKADAITVNPYLGFEALAPFLACKDRGIFILCRTSNQGAGEFQDLRIDGVPLYQIIARNVATAWNVNKNCGVVVGATDSDGLWKVRQEVGEMPILIPGVGNQGGDMRQAVMSGFDVNGSGIIISASRSIIFASSGPDFAEAARVETMRVRDAVNHCRDNFLHF
ncbi:MAG: orotidine-5'-phosphate decarboxylase [bacterium]|nr:orotidine-5'-phosphate decarboxylase [bacterium]